MKVVNFSPLLLGGAGPLEERRSDGPGALHASQKPPHFRRGGRVRTYGQAAEIVESLAYGSDGDGDSCPAHAGDGIRGVLIPIRIAVSHVAVIQPVLRLGLVPVIH